MHTQIHSRFWPSHMTMPMWHTSFTKTLPNDQMQKSLLHSLIWNVSVVRHTYESSDHWNISSHHNLLLKCCLFHVPWRKQILRMVHSYFTKTYQRFPMWSGYPWEIMALNLSCHHSSYLRMWRPQAKLTAINFLETLTLCFRSNLKKSRTLSVGVFGAYFLK